MNIIKKFYTDNPNHYFLTGKTKPQSLVLIGSSSPVS